MNFIYVYIKICIGVLNYVKEVYLFLSLKLNNFFIFYIKNVPKNGVYKICTRTYFKFRNANKRVLINIHL